ncbi:hypothetical protein KPSA1_02078 [Pseudomonas syringae pv. actinidiae]|uniref:Uncharacterized protein n=1 Tax=Pseudomonas syringae pv. actinidiae TaxID=103796 RepID=A0A2V0Q7A5_PSESF|nr:hypothetical protein KPSA1_02078 [Pseudomonas syringae pv. actinidiae]
MSKRSVARLTPTLDIQRTCGSELARESGLT